MRKIIRKDFLDVGHFYQLDPDFEGLEQSSCGGFGGGLHFSQEGAHRSLGVLERGHVIHRT